MAEVRAAVRLLIPAGKAKPSPQIGQALGPLGINMMAFCKEVNERTKPYKDDTPMRIKLLAMRDSTYTFEVLLPPTTYLLKKAAGIDLGASSGGEIVGTVHVKQIYEIAKIQSDVFIKQGRWGVTLEGVCKSIVGTARTMGLGIDTTRNVLAAAPSAAAPAAAPPSKKGGKS